MSKKPPKVQNLDIPWRKVVLDADVDWAADRHRELEYDFSAPGRRFWGDPYKRGPYKPRPYNNGRLNRTLARLQAHGTALIDGRSGTAAITFAPLTLTASGFAPITGVGAASLGPMTGSATGLAIVGGTLNVMLDWMRAAEQFGPMWISVGVGRVDIKGVGIGAIGPMTAEGTGTVAGAQPGEGSPVGLLLAITSVETVPAQTPDQLSFSGDALNYDGDDLEWGG
jgi:hypothetical protein